MNKDRQDTQARQPLLYICRHGQTKLNKADAYRGWTDIGLDKEGKRQAEEIGDFFELKDIDSVLCSDLKRAEETALAIERSVYAREDLRPWNIGKFAGKSKSKENKKGLEFYIDHRNKTVPGGESLNDFHERWQDTLDHIITYAKQVRYPVVLVVSTSNIVATKEMYDPSGLDLRPEEHDIIEPGGIVGFYMNGKNVKIRPLLGEIEQKSAIRVS